MRKRIKNNILLMAMSVLPLSAMGQTVVGEFKPGLVADGVNYYLPNTVLKVDVSAIKVVYTPGEFAKYADRYLHISGVKEDATTEWTVTNMTTRQEGTPDKKKCYTVKFRAKTVAPFVRLTKEGILAGVNSDYEQTVFALPQSTSTKHKLDAKQYLTDEILSANSLAKMAQLTAQEILEIRASKNALKRGEVESMPKDGATMRIVLDELNLQEEALTQLFIGHVDTTYCYKTYSCTPGKKDINDEVLFRFSKRLGFVEADDLVGEPYYVSIKDKHTVNKPTPLEEAKRKFKGIIYNMPSMATVTLSNLNGTILSTEMPFAQYGTIDELGTALFDKGATTKVTISPTTGGMLKLTQ